MIKFRNDSYSGLSAAVVINEKVRLYSGVTDHWGFAVALNLYDRSFTIEILKWYFGIEVWHRVDDEDEVN
jgi:hypothetical protein